MQQIRMFLRCTGIVVIIGNVIKGHTEKNPALEMTLPHSKGHVGFVLTHSELVEVRDKFLETEVKASTRAGAIAPLPVIVSAQNTGLSSDKTTFFQALSIPTKSSKLTIEIINDVLLSLTC